MTDHETPHLGAPPPKPPEPNERRRYSAPVLKVFGRISTLTQSASGCATSDNPACTGGPAANMGPIPRLQR